MHLHTMNGYPHFCSFPHLRFQLVVKQSINSACRFVKYREASIADGNTVTQNKNNNVELSTKIQSIKSKPKDCRSKKKESTTFK